MVGSMVEVFAVFPQDRVPQRLVEQILGLQDFSSAQHSTALRGADFAGLQGFSPGQDSPALRGAHSCFLKPFSQGRVQQHFVEPVFKISFQNTFHRRRHVEMISVLVGNAMSWMTAVCSGTMYSRAKRLKRTRTTWSRRRRTMRTMMRGSSLLVSVLVGGARSGLEVLFAREAKRAPSRTPRIGVPLRPPALEVPQTRSTDSDMDIFGPCRSVRNTGR